ncbi:hypothetical protein [Lysobacter gummosus]|uniref:hypothetical protein n=1 Tax=Lysobacter gummosus TaxID=262324 RepID=UPI003634DCA2
MSVHARIPGCWSARRFDSGFISTASMRSARTHHASMIEVVALDRPWRRRRRESSARKIPPRGRAVDMAAPSYYVPLPQSPLTGGPRGITCLRV